MPQDKAPSIVTKALQLIIIRPFLALWHYIQALGRKLFGKTKSLSTQQKPNSPPTPQKVAKRDTTLTDHVTWMQVGQALKEAKRDAALIDDAKRTLQRAEALLNSIGRDSMLSLNILGLRQRLDIYTGAGYRTLEEAAKALGEEFTDSERILKFELEIIKQNIKQVENSLQEKTEAARRQAIIDAERTRREDAEKARQARIEADRLHREEAEKAERARIEAKIKADRLRQEEASKVIKEANQTVEKAKTLTKGKSTNSELQTALDTITRILTVSFSNNFHNLALESALATLKTEIEKEEKKIKEAAAEAEKQKREAREDQEALAPPPLPFAHPSSEPPPGPPPAYTKEDERLFAAESASLITPKVAEIIERIAAQEPVSKDELTMAARAQADTISGLIVDGKLITRDTKGDLEYYKRQIENALKEDGLRYSSEIQELGRRIIYLHTKLPEAEKEVNIQKELRQRAADAIAQAQEILKDPKKTPPYPIGRDLQSSIDSIQFNLEDSYIFPNSYPFSRIEKLINEITDLVKKNKDSQMVTIRSR